MNGSGQGRGGSILDTRQRHEIPLHDDRDPAEEIPVAGGWRDGADDPAGLPRREYLPFGMPNFSEEEIQAVVRTMRTGWIGMGAETLRFEEELAAFLGAPQVVTVNSCTSALFLSLLVHGIGEGDEVVCPSLTWCSTANAALYLGATPVFCDVDPETLCVTPESVRQALTDRTRAVILVHFGGCAADADAIRAILPGRVALIEDAAHALGARFPDGRRVGASGNATCFSFYANKNLSTGEGGAIALADAATADRLRSLRQHGLARDAWSRYLRPSSLRGAVPAELGYKMNFTDLQAAIGRVQLRRQPELQAVRSRIAQVYSRELERWAPDVGLQRGVTHPDHARHLFTATLPLGRMTLTRDEFVVRLRAAQVGASIHYAPLHRMPLYAGAAGPQLPETERIADSIVTLPISATMSTLDARYVLHVFRQILGSTVH